jgi:AcrR family transcriptional regulator
VYYSGVPKLWTETIETHRGAVRDSIMETATTLVTERGLTSVTMSQIAEQVGIGRATLYKYFPDVEAILIAWHGRLVAAHLAHLAALRDRTDGPDQRLAAVLGAYALICHHRGRHGGEIAALVHRGEPIARAEQQLLELFGDLLADVAATGRLRDDIAPGELANFCLHALAAAGSLPSEAAVARLVAVTLDGLRAAGAANTQTAAERHPPAADHHPRKHPHAGRGPHS